MVNQSKFIIITSLLASIIIVGVMVFLPKKQPVVPSYVTPVVQAEVPKTTSVSSSDGKMTINMKEEKGKDGKTYVFNVGKYSFSKNVSLDTTITIPANTFSPDNKFFFLKETEGETSKYLVYSSSNLQIAEIVSLFDSKYKEFKITDVTGWGGMNLLVVNTDVVNSDKSDGGQGPSFWFELPSLSFIKLATRFN